MELAPIETETLETVTGGAGEGVMGWVRGAALGASLLTGNPAQLPPIVEPVAVELPASGIQR